MGAIPTSADQLSAEDRMLIKMKEVSFVSDPRPYLFLLITPLYQDGKGWAEIKEAWHIMTGTVPGGTTLSGRYIRLKANLARVKESDVELMKKCMEKTRLDIEEEKKQLDKKFWTRVGEAMVLEGAEKYEAGTLEKESKRMTQSADTADGGDAGDVGKDED